jgi:hypothetical protein
MGGITRESSRLRLEIKLKDGSSYCSPEPVFVDLLRRPGIDSQPGGPVRQPYFSYRPARLHRLTTSIPRNRFLDSINVYKYGLWNGEGASKKLGRKWSKGVNVVLERYCFGHLNWGKTRLIRFSVINWRPGKVLLRF